MWMNADAKTEILNLRVNRAMKAALKKRANAVAGGSVSLVITRLVATAMKHWPKDAANAEETA